MKQNTPHLIKYKGSYIGIGVGPIYQKGRKLTVTELRDEIRNLARSLNDEALEDFMSNLRIVGIHAPERETNWEWCPLKQFKGFCPGCTEIYAVRVSNYQTIA